MASKLPMSCACGKKLLVSDEHLGKKVKCPGCGSLLRVERPAEAPAGEPVAAPPPPNVPVASAPSGSPPSRFPKWMIGAVAAGVALLAGMIGYFAVRSGPGLSLGLGGSSKLNVDNLSAETLEVKVDGTSKGSVKPFEVGVFEVSAGEHELEAAGPGGVVDRATAKMIAGKTTVFCPRGRGAYMVEVATYVSDPARTFLPGSGGRGGRELRNQKLAEADFGPLEPIPRTIQMAKPGEAARTKLYRLPPEKLTAAEAVAYLKVKPESFLGDATPAAFNALILAPDAKGAREAIVACLERGEWTLAVDYALLKIWELGIELPEERLAHWVTASSTGSGDQHNLGIRAMHAALLLAEKGKLAAAARLSDERTRSQGNIRFEELLKVLPPARAQAVYRGMLLVFPRSALWALKQGWIKPDEETGRQIDAFIQRLPPDKRDGPSDRADWLEARGESLRKSGGTQPLEQLLDLLINSRPGTHQSGVALQVVSANRFRELAATAPKLAPGPRRMLYHQYANYRLMKKTPATEDEVAFLEAGLQEPDDLWRMQLVSTVVSSARSDKDPRLLAWVRSAIEKEPNAKNKRNLQSMADQLLKD